MSRNGYDTAQSERQPMQAREHHISHDHIHRKEEYARRIRRIERERVVSALQSTSPGPPKDHGSQRVVGRAPRPSCSGAPALPPIA